MNSFDMKLTEHITFCDIKSHLLVLPYGSYLFRILDPFEEYVSWDVSRACARKILNIIVSDMKSSCYLNPFKLR